MGKKKTVGRGQFQDSPGSRRRPATYEVGIVEDHYRSRINNTVAPAKTVPRCPPWCPHPKKPRRREKKKRRLILGLKRAGDSHRASRPLGRGNFARHEIRSYCLKAQRCLRRGTPRGLAPTRWTARMPIKPTGDCACPRTCTHCYPPRRPGLGRSAGESRRLTSSVSLIPLLSREEDRRSSPSASAQPATVAAARQLGAGAPDGACGTLRAATVRYMTAYR